jgi:hypothetical protein
MSKDKIRDRDLTHAYWALTRTLGITHTRAPPTELHTRCHFKNTIRPKIQHYRRLYVDRPDPIVFMPIPVNTSVHLYHDLIRLLFLHTHLDTSTLTRELTEESDQFRLLHTVSLSHLNGSVGLILPKALAMRVSIPLDLSTRTFIPLPSFYPFSTSPLPDHLFPRTTKFPPHSA